MNKTQDPLDNYVGKITKKYIIDLLNGLFFSKQITWDGDDQYNELPIFIEEQVTDHREEQRGALLISRASGKALRVAVAVISTPHQQKVCYYLKSLKEPLLLETHKRMIHPQSDLVIDITIADLNIGVSEPSSYSFYDDADSNGDISSKKLFTLVNFLTTCDLITMDNKELFRDMINSSKSLPPGIASQYYKPIFGACDSTVNGDR